MRRREIVQLDRKAARFIRMKHAQAMKAIMEARQEAEKMVDLLVLELSKTTSKRKSHELL